MTLAVQEFWRRVQDPATEHGLYLCVKDADFVDLSVSTIQSVAAAYWGDLSKHDSNLKNAAGFQLCPVCSHRGEDRLCGSIQPFLALRETMDHFSSFDSTLAAYRDTRGLTYIAKTALQRALQFVVQFGILGFCDIGQRYHHWFAGTHPLMSTMEVAKRIHLNVYWIEHGDQQAIAAQIAAFTEILRTIVRCQIDRLALVSQSDTLVNALVNFDLVGKFVGPRAMGELAADLSPGK